MTPPRDLYRILQVDPAAEREVIRAAYVCLAKRRHPDAGGTDEGMAVLNEAWSVLGDPGRRAAYDTQRRVASAQAAPVWASAGDARPVYAAAQGDTRQGSHGSVLDFGRYAGWTLEALVREDPDYLEWLARAPGGRQYRTEIYALLSRRSPNVPRATRTTPPAGAGWHMPWRARAVG
jgi:curved DNA-binding protein CbpA